MSVARATVLLYALAGAAVLGLLERAQEGARVRSKMVTGRAAAAAGDSGAFAMPGPPPGVRPVVPRADAESAAVALGYRYAPSYRVLGAGHYEERPAERRSVCGRSYYVRSVVALPPDSVTASSVTNDIVATWGPAWVVPVCDDAGFARTTAIVADAPTRLRVLLGDQPGDVPVLVYPRDSYGHVGRGDFPHSRDWERGIALSPETAVAVAVARLAGTGARVTEVPEAFKVVVRSLTPPKHSTEQQSAIQPHSCPRWRLTLDRAVTLRGTASDQIVRTRTVYVARGDNGCAGAPALQIPRPVQPGTLPFMYGVLPGLRRDFVLPPADVRPAKVAGAEIRWTALRVTEPIWFEGARLAPDGAS
ncbi:MAG: hypothetical protein ABR499_00620 [Gemmatimonadaceae bacterium]